MTKQICLTVLALCTILMILVVGCVTPPKGTTTSTTSGSYYATETTSSETPTPPAYVSEVTPFTTSNPGAQTTIQDITRMRHLRRLLQICPALSIITRSFFPIT